MDDMNHMNHIYYTHYNEIIQLWKSGDCKQQEYVIDKFGEMIYTADDGKIFTQFFIHLFKNEMYDLLDKFEEITPFSVYFFILKGIAKDGDINLINTLLDRLMITKFSIYSTMQLRDIIISGLQDGKHYGKYVDYLPSIEDIINSKFLGDCKKIINNIIFMKYVILLHAILKIYTS